jgi:hypothetical protein
MARRGRPRHGVSGQPDAEALHGERALIAAFLRQVLADAGSRDPQHRQEALVFLEDEAAVGWWCDLAGIDAHVFLRRVQRWLR